MVRTMTTYQPTKEPTYPGSAMSMGVRGVCQGSGVREEEGKGRKKKYQTPNSPQQGPEREKIVK